LKDRAGVHEIIEDGDYVVPLGVGAMCAFLDEEYFCRIYADRPEVCRLYGIDPSLPCPWMKPNGKPRSVAGHKRAQREINRVVDATLARLRK
jgi:hypothetical protein